MQVPERDVVRGDREDGGRDAVLEDRLGGPLAAAEDAPDAGEVRHQQVDRGVAESAGQRRDNLADHLVVGAHVLRRGLRDDLGRPHRVALGQERQHRHLHIRPVRAGPEADHPALIRAAGPLRPG